MLELTSGAPRRDNWIWTIVMRTRLQAISFHEAGHAVTSIALRHEVKMVEMDLRPGARFPGRTHHVAAGLAGDNFITEGFTVVWAAGGLSEIRHDPEWCPEPHFRND